MGYHRIVKILQKRDGMSEAEAQAVVRDVKSQIEMAIQQGDYDGVESIMADQLGLEMDYAFDLIDWGF